MEEYNQKTQPENQKATIKSKNKPILKILLIGLAFVVVISASAYGGYWYKSKSAKQEISTKNQQIIDLEAKKKELEDAKAKLEQENADYKATSSANNKQSTAKTLNESDKENIIDSIKSGNTAPLEGFMASKVTVILAASEGIGVRTPTQAVSDIKYIDAGKDPWNFDLPDATLSKWQKNKYYGKYFPESAVVGKSANDYVISFSINDDAKISTVFMSASSDLLN
jgi:hypothetical protein